MNSPIGLSQRRESVASNVLLRRKYVRDSGALLAEWGRPGQVVSVFHSEKLRMTRCEAL